MAPRAAFALPTELKQLFYLLCTFFFTFSPADTTNTAEASPFSSSVTILATKILLKKNSFSCAFLRKLHHATDCTFLMIEFLFSVTFGSSYRCSCVICVIHGECNPSPSLYLTLELKKHRYQYFGHVQTPFIISIENRE